jgi:SAM-dependent methyltransferase
MHDVLFALDEPQYQSVVLDEINTFRGAALALAGSVIRSVVIARDGVTIAEADVNLPCPEFAFLQLPNASTSRFVVDVRVPRGGALEIRGRREDGREELLFTFDVPFVEANQTRLDELSRAVRALPVPGGDLVAVTQGGRDTRSYQESMISGLVSAELVLRRAGIDPESIRAVLDVGCGTGRLLSGWRFASSAPRRLFGVDVNAALIEWASENLRDVAEFHASAPLPPLSLDADAFDLAILASVFTHFPLGWQRAWAAELWRVLRPGGIVLMTLHGTPYVVTLLDAAQRAEYERNGYVEVANAAPGESAFGTFHSPEFADEVMQPFHRRARFPFGEVTSWFPIASWQDVYLFEKPSTGSVPIVLQKGRASEAPVKFESTKT